MFAHQNKVCFHQVKKVENEDIKLLQKLMTCAAANMGNSQNIEIAVGFMRCKWFSQTLKFIYSGKATKIYEISTLLLSKSKVEILQNFMAFSEYMNFIFKTFITNL